MTNWKVRWKNCQRKNPGKFQRKVIKWSGGFPSVWIWPETKFQEKITHNWHLFYIVWVGWYCNILHFLLLWKVWKIKVGWYCKYITLFIALKRVKSQSQLPFHTMNNLNVPIQCNPYVCFSGDGWTILQSATASFQLIVQPCRIQLMHHTIGTILQTMENIVLLYNWNCFSGDRWAVPHLYDWFLNHSRALHNLWWF